MTDESYLTIAAETRAEPDKVKGSRHIGTAVPIADEADVAPVLERLREEFPNSNHHAYAWRLGRNGERFHYSDDGEPSGSAGRPILQHLEGRDLTNLLVAVSRIFGGTKLGVGGLVRAYSGAAAFVLDAAEVVRVVPQARLRVVFPYECSNSVQALVHAEELVLVDAQYESDVTMTLEMPESRADETMRQLRDATAGVADVRRL